MPALHAAAAAGLSAARRVSPTSVTITRGSSEQAATALVGKTVFTDKGSTDTSNRAVSRVETRDYLLPAAEYLVDDVAARPAAGDVIVEAGRTYEVVSTFGEPPFRFADPGQTWIRVHTLLVNY